MCLRSAFRVIAAFLPSFIFPTFAAMGIAFSRRDGNKEAAADDDDAAVQNHSPWTGDRCAMGTAPRFREWTRETWRDRDRMSDPRNVGAINFARYAGKVFVHLVVCLAAIKGDDDGGEKWRSGASKK